MSAEPIWTDRSRVLAWQRCPRLRWWNYEYGGRGIVPLNLSIPLTTGAAVHEGLAELVAGNGIEAALCAALEIGRAHV